MTLAALLVAAGALATRWNALGYRAGLLVYALGGLLAVIALAAGLVALARTGADAGLLAAVAVAALLAAPVAYWAVRGVTAPPIHDISTDLEDPPGLRVLLERRPADANPARHAGAELAAAQRAAYPDVKPLVTDADPDRVFAAAMAAAADMGWERVAVDPDARRLEATATSFWFGFKDDVVVRVRAVEPGARLDVRSLSRVGVSDLGANARRIRTYLEAVAARLP